MVAVNIMIFKVTGLVLFVNKHYVIGDNNLIYIAWIDRYFV
jgi:hypothetical protein